MAESPIRPFTGFHVEPGHIRKFDLRLQRLVIDRRLSWSSLSGDKPEFATSIRGEAIAEHEEVCVFGTGRRSNVFDLTIDSDVGVVELWESIKGIDLLVDHDGSDPERRRIRDLQHKKFEKTPPTATLFYYQYYWRLECHVPQTVLEQLSEDLLICGVDRVHLEIEWPFGLTDEQAGSWGFFDGGQLRGYVTKLVWRLLAEEPNQSGKQEAGDPVSEERTLIWARRIQRRIRRKKGG